MNFENAVFYVLINGKRYDIVRDVCTSHDSEIHAALGTSNESELQMSLDNLYMGNWFDASGRYLGEDCFGLGVDLRL